jgi:hypothetical protein
MVFGWLRRKAAPDGVPPPADSAAGPKTRTGLRAEIESLQKSTQDEARVTAEDPLIEIARRRFIVFREIFPPPHNPSLSFYGGAPIGPPGMAWPRNEADGKPLTFLMQWDVAALAAEDATGLLPPDGALYFFSNLGWGTTIAFRFIHVGSDGQIWAPLPEPDDLPPIFNRAADPESPPASWHVPADQLHAPRRLPRKPFVPVGVDYTESMDGDEENSDGRQFWTNGHDLKEALLRAQDPHAAPQQAIASRSGFERPFPAFPHDWIAVRLVAAEALKKAGRVSPADWEKLRPGTDTAARSALTAAWRETAQAMYVESVAFPVTAAVPQHRADAIWSLMTQFQLILGASFDHVVQHAVNLSFGLGSEAASVIPAEYVEACAQRHRLATLTIRAENEPEFKASRGLDLDWKQISAAYKHAKEAGALRTVRDIWAPPPNRMFGPPSYVQGDVAEFVDEWLLLLELSSPNAVGWPQGDGVLQFLIRPNDLRAKRFDQVESISTGY